MVRASDTGRTHVGGSGQQEGTRVKDLEVNEGVVHAGGTARPPETINTKKGERREVRENEGPLACTNQGGPAKHPPLTGD